MKASKTTASLAADRGRTAPLGLTTSLRRPASLRLARPLLRPRTARHATAAGLHARRRLVHEQEGPLVVVVSPLVQADRLVLALAEDAHHSAGYGAAAESRRAGHGRAAGWPRLDVRRTGLSAPLRAGKQGTLTRKRRPGPDRNEVVVGDGILV